MLFSLIFPSISSINSDNVPGKWNLYGYYSEDTTPYLLDSRELVSSDWLNFYTYDDSYQENLLPQGVGEISKNAWPASIKGNLALPSGSSIFPPLRNDGSTIGAHHHKSITVSEKGDDSKFVSGVLAKKKTLNLKHIVAGHRARFEFFGMLSCMRNKLQSNRNQN